VTAVARVAAQAAGQRDQVRRLVPVPLIPLLVRRRIDVLWRNPAFREGAEASMEFVLGCSSRADEAADLARGYAEHTLLRAYLRWHPRAICSQPVRGVEWLTTRRDPGRGVLLSFMHHANYDGLWASIARHGVRLTAVATPDLMSGEAPLAFRQHMRVVARGAEVALSTLGTEGIADLLRRPGAIVGLASDMPGRTPVTFLGRPVLGSFGAARIASLTDSPVVVVTTERDAAGRHLQVHEPLDPRDFEDPKDLLDALLRIHEGAVLAWPEALEAPLNRFAPVED
jgi:lauroyl/myristoyl acyltransferase